MSVAAAIRKMLGQGLTIEQALIAAEAMEEAAVFDGHRAGDAAERRRAWDRDRKRKQRASALSGGNPVESGGNAECPVDTADVPREPAGSNINLPSGDIKNLPSEGKKTTGVVHPLPLNEAFDAWDQTAKRCGLPTIRDRTSARIRQLQARLKAHGLDGWIEALTVVERSAFLTGQNGRGWRASFDFVVKTENFAKIREGAYAKPEDAPKAASAEPKIAPPKRPETEAEWDALLKRIRPLRQWHEAYGPPPYEADTLVPKHLITFKDTDYWQIRRAS